MTPADEYITALDRIEEALESGATELDLSQLPNLKQFPHEISDLVGLTELKAWGTKISDLSPLQGLTALQTLELNSPQVSDITPLQGLTALQTLYLTNTQISDISPLQGLTDLQTLDLNSTQVSDISPLRGLTALQRLDLNSTQVVDLRPLRDLAFDIQTKRGDSSLWFQDTPATRADPELARFANIKDRNDRTQQTLAYLRSLPAPPAPLPWQVPDVALADRPPDPPEPDAVPRILWTGDQIDVDHAQLSEQDITDPIKRRMFDRLQKTLDDLKRIGNRHPEVAAPARRLSDACANGFESADLLDIHIEVATLTDIVASNGARSNAERVDEEDLDIIRKTTRLGPPLTLGNPDVDLFEQRNADYANLRRPETVSHAERMIAEALDTDAPMTPRAHQAIQRSAEATSDGRLAAYNSSLVKNALLTGVGAVALGYLSQIGGAGATWSLEFFVAHKDAIMTVATSWGDQAYLWAADMVQRSQEILRIVKNRPPKT